MIDHVSLAVRDLARSTALYEAMLAPLGHRKLVTRERTTGFGKRYAELWLNLREGRAPQGDSGMHVCLRAPTTEQVEAFYQAALRHGARGDGEPGMRPEYHDSYFAAFVRDLDDNLLEVVTFVNVSSTAP